MLVRLLCLALLLAACPLFAAPPLSDGERQRLHDETADGDDVLDQQGGLYVLLRNAAGWMGDDFSGDRGAAAAPTPDYAFLREHPAEARGDVFLIEGWVVRAERFPTNDNHGRDRLVRAGDPAWGDQLTRWTIVTEKGDASATVIVLFNDPNARMTTPGESQRVRVAARFFKLWAFEDAQGQPFTFPVFVGGAAETVGPAGSAGGTPYGTVVTIVVIVAAGAFFFIRYMLAKRTAGPTRLRERLEAMRRERALYEDEDNNDDDETVDDLPDDPVAALDALRSRRGSD